MPTINPRIGLTVLPHRYDLLKRLAALQGVSMASLVSELLEEFYPVLERVCVALEMAQNAQESSKTGIRESAARAEAEMLPLAAAAMDQLDMFLTGLHAASAPPSENLNPRVVTRGSGSKRHSPLIQVKPSSGNASRGGPSK